MHASCIWCKDVFVLSSPCPPPPPSHPPPKNVIMEASCVYFLPPPLTHVPPIVEFEQFEQSAAKSEDGLYLGA